MRTQRSHVSFAAGYVPNRRFDDPEFRLRFARIVTHYWRHAAFLEDCKLMRDALCKRPGSCTSVVVSALNHVKMELL
jgi:hypothetical protein